ncbi:MAG TPA: alpha/beta hydrolase, partial [Dehalococcoidia bacterium]|nr:alpha/beta hydrolase [Dehalococcoidia bacterium]
MAYVAVDGARIWYEDTGGDGPLVVLLHAAAGHSACWVEQVPAFSAAGLRVLAYDMRGFGKTESERSAEGSIAGDLESMIQSLKLPPFFLVATAYGGFGGVEFSLDNPDRVRALVLSTSFGGLTDPEFTAERAKHIAPDLTSRPVVERELGATYRGANPEGTQRWLGMEQSSYKGDGARQRLRRPTTLTRLETMRVPAMVIAADEDAYAPPPVMKLLAD